MHLLRVQVPNFRVLKDVDIEFEKEFTPQVFPLGSQNGGGKSTLLQLIFTLLHCSTNPDRFIFLKNMIGEFKIPKGSDTRILATIDILDGDKVFCLNFLGCHDSYISNLLNQKSATTNNAANSPTSDSPKFSVLSELKIVEEKLSRITNEESRIKKVLVELKAIESKDVREQKGRFDRLLRDLRRFESWQWIRMLESSQPQPRQLQEEIEERLKIIEDTYSELRSEKLHLSNISNKILDTLASHNLIHIVNYSSDGSQSEDAALVCHINDIEAKEVKSLLDSFSDKVFLAAPSTQVFLFLSQEARKLLFKNQKSTYPSGTYYSYIQQAKDKLPGLFAYDFLAVDLLIDSFKAARDRDFEEAIENGEYGDHYKALLNGLNSMLSNKQLNLKVDLSGVTFKMGEDGEVIELFPEDLSHGELKRLSIYMWLIHQNIKDSIVLMDEIEIALHPDWQFKIVSDLLQWAPTNQYILATHSYQLCEAVTPIHVKELEPRLLKQAEQPA